MYKVGVVGSLSRAGVAILHPDLDVRAVCDIREKQVSDHLKVLNHQRGRLSKVKENGPIHGYTDYLMMLKKEKLDIVVDATISVCLAAEESAASGRPVEPRRWEPLSYKGKAPKLEVTDYMKGFMRSHHLNRAQRIAILNTTPRQDPSAMTPRHRAS